MIVSVLGTIIPPMGILSLISLFYKAFASNLYVALVLKSMQAGVAAVIFDVVCSLGTNVLKNHSRLQELIMVAAFIAVLLFDVNVVVIILAAALVGSIHAIWARKREREV